MDFTLSKEHEMARTLFREFAEKEVKPLAQEVDETEEFPRETVEKMAKLGFLGIPVPKEYGGQGCDPLTYAMCVEELSKVCGTTGVIVSAHTSLCCDPIMTYGTEEQKQKYLVPLAKGEKLGAFGLTEPGAGTDAQGQQTKAYLDGDEWVLNGSKIFITNGKEADVYVIFAVTSVVEDKRGRKKKMISAFIVEKGTPGFTFGTKEKKMGIRGSSTYELIFTDCRIPKDNLLGAEGKGFGIAMHTLDGGRIVLLFKPYKVGDWIESQGVSGTVKEIQIFHTILTTGDNKVIYIPNGAMSSGVVTNYNTQTTRRVEWIVGVDYGEDYNKVQQIVRDILTADNRILTDPAPFIALHALDASSVNVVARVWVNTADYWGVYFDINKTIYETFNEKGINFPFPQLTVHQGN